jgi:hypothetical protein
LADQFRTVSSLEGRKQKFWAWDCQNDILIDQRQRQQRLQQRLQIQHCWAHNQTGSVLMESGWSEIERLLFAFKQLKTQTGLLSMMEGKKSEEKSLDERSSHEGV